MSEQSPEDFIKGLSKDDIARLGRLLKTLRQIEGWCRINRALGHFLIVTIIGFIIVASQGFDAIRNLFGWKH